MFNYKIREKYEDYLSEFAFDQDKTCDYDNEPINYDEFERNYMEWHKND